MKRIIGGVTYNTETSALIATIPPIDGDTRTEVYETRTGYFFALHVSSVDGKARFEPITPEQFRALLAEANIRAMAPHHGTVVESVQRLEDFLNDSRRNEPEATVFVRLPTSLKRRLDQAAQARSLSMNSLAIRWFEQCLAEGEK